MKEKNIPETPNPGFARYKTDRRSLIGATVGVAGLLALGAAAKSSGEPAFLRPPGSREEDEFLARCLRCDRCRSVCHTNVIAIASWSDGLKTLRTPVLNFRLGHCDFCHKCADVCPTGAIEDFDPDTFKIGVAELTKTCIALRTGACTVCKEKCPEEAITLDERNRPVIDPELCNGCGLCVTMCPANVLQSYKSSVDRGIVVKHLPRGESEGNAS